MQAVRMKILFFNITLGVSMFHQFGKENYDD